MLNSVKLQQLRITPGARAGLAEPTATCGWTGLGALDNEPALTARLRVAVGQLWPAEPLPGVAAQDWPQALLVDTSARFDGVAAWSVALTVAIQRLARDPVGPGRVLSSGSGACTVALPWQREWVLKDAMRLALQYLLLWQHETGTQPQRLAAFRQGFERWLLSAQQGGLAPNTMRFALAARARGVPVSVALGMLNLGWGVNSVRMDSSFTSRTSMLAVRLARLKSSTSQLLRAGRVPVPSGGLASDWPTALKLAQSLGWPVVVKPSNQDQGRAVVPGIGDEATLNSAFLAAAKFSPGAVIVEQHVAGADHRMLVVGGKLRMATRRTAGGVTGDGSSSVTRLVADLNTDPRRGTGKRSMMIALALDAEALGCLAGQGLNAQSVPQAGRFVHLRRTANISTGGSAQDVTAQVHPDNRLVAERAARLVGLDIAGVDFLCPDISRSWREVGGAVCEVNAQPGFRPHWLGDPSRDINGEIIEWLFQDQPARIPTAAITGTNGKSTTARMLHHIWMTAGKNTGVCTTSGVWIGHDLVSDQNLSGHPGARILLNDPAVEAAVIEMPRKGLIAFGHPCDNYDVAALLNVRDDHIGVDGIDSLAAMARLKGEVLARASQAVVVNADDPLCLAMLEHATGKRRILVAQTPGTPALQAHLAHGGEAVFTQMHDAQPWIVLAQGALQTPLMPLTDIPATMNGLLCCNESNAMFAAALAWAQGIELATIRQALAGFSNSVQQSPGRYNFIAGWPFQVLLDNAHNPDGVGELCKLVGQLPVLGQCRLVSLKPGSRHRAHLAECAPMLAATFQHFVLGSDHPDYVRRSPDYQGEDPLATMLGAYAAELQHHGVPAEVITMHHDPRQAIAAGLAQCLPGDLLVVLVEPWLALPILERRAQAMQADSTVSHGQEQLQELAPSHDHIKP